MNRNASLKWNTLLCAFAWFDIRMTKVFSNTLPSHCLQVPNTTPVVLK